MTIYVYKPLATDQIRLLKTQTASKLDDPIIGRLKHVLLPTSKDGSTGYSTLSYVWGPTFLDGSHLTDEVVYDGEVVPITYTLAQALRLFREKVVDDRRLLAIILVKSHGDQRARALVLADGVCNNQDDKDERAWQLGLVACIYSLLLLYHI
ncbi:hypothetical protein LTR27_012426 [Elasticomyces elasticus]|nr:hypothetical protein LTR27_012426 [Elasticomyces elasticus]